MSDLEAYDTYVAGVYYPSDLVVGHPAGARGSGDRVDPLVVVNA